MKAKFVFAWEVEDYGEISINLNGGEKIDVILKKEDSWSDGWVGEFLGVKSNALFIKTRLGTEIGIYLDDIVKIDVLDEDWNPEHKDAWKLAEENDEFINSWMNAPMGRKE